MNHAEICRECELREKVQTAETKLYFLGKRSMKLLDQIIDLEQQNAVLSERGKDLHDILMDVMGDCVLSDGMRSEIVRLVKLWEECEETLEREEDWD